LRPLKLYISTTYFIPKNQVLASKFSLSTLFCILILSLFISCHKIEVDTTKKENPITHFEKQIIRNWILEQKKQFDNGSKDQIDSFLVLADWEKASKILSADTIRSIFYLPLNKKKTGLCFFYNETSKRIDSANINRIISENEQLPIQGIKNYFDLIVLKQKINNSFTGSIAAYSFTNKFLYEYSFTNGLVTSHSYEVPRGSYSKLTNNSNSDKKIRNNSEDCTWYGHFTEWSDGTITLDYVYLLCNESCQTTSISYPSAIKDIKFNCGGGIDPNTLEPEPFGIDCESFVFTHTASNWQEAGIQNHRINMVWMGGERHGLSIKLTIESPIIIGFPINRIDGTHYSLGRAAEMASGCVQYATEMTNRSLKNEPFRPTDSQIESTFRTHLNEAVLLYSGTSGRTGSSSSAIYINKIPKYRIFGIGNCD
jgi:hypothetical protein